MKPRYLLDTHIVIRWVSEPRKLSRAHYRILETSVSRSEPVGLSAVSLLEVAALAESGRIRASLPEIFDFLQAEPVFEILPITYEIASEVSAIRALRDPADRAIVATARVHGLRLITSDQRIIASNLVPVVE